MLKREDEKPEEQQQEKPPERVENPAAKAAEQAVKVAEKPKAIASDRVEFLTDDELERLNHPGVSVAEKEELSKRLVDMLAEGEEEYDQYFEAIEPGKKPCLFGELTLRQQIAWARSARDNNTQAARREAYDRIRKAPAPQAAKHRVVPYEERKPYPDHSAHEEGKAPAYHPAPDSYKEE